MDFDLSSNTISNVDLLIPSGNLLVINGNGVVLPNGNTASRPVNPPIGTIRINTDLGSYEFFVANAWSTAVNYNSIGSILANNLPTVANSVLGLGNLSNVLVSNATDGQVLQYNGTQWVASTISSVSGGSSPIVQSFNTVLPKMAGTATNTNQNVSINSGSKIWKYVINPTSSSNKIRVWGSFYANQYNPPYYGWSFVYNVRLSVCLFRNSTLVGTASTELFGDNINLNTAGSIQYGSMINFNFLDTPATTSAIPYTIVFFSDTSGTWYIGQDPTNIGAPTLNGLNNNFVSIEEVTG